MNINIDQVYLSPNEVYKILQLRQHISILISKDMLLLTSFPLNTVARDQR